MWTRRTHSLDAVFACPRTRLAPEPWIGRVVVVSFPGGESWAYVDLTIKVIQYYDGYALGARHTVKRPPLIIVRDGYTVVDLAWYASIHVMATG
jgi:hypothetical protein